MLMYETGRWFNWRLSQEGAVERMLGRPRVLVVEDEYFIAHEIAGALQQRGATIVGPVPNPDAAMREVEKQVADVVVLDLNLQGKVDFALADELARRQVPFVFATGYDAGIIPTRFATVARFEKPYNADDLAAYLVDVAFKASSARP